MVHKQKKIIALPIAAQQRTYYFLENWEWRSFHKSRCSNVTPCKYISCTVVTYPLMTEEIDARITKYFLAIAGQLKWLVRLIR